jgi:hypothetical protein
MQNKVHLRASGSEASASSQEPQQAGLVCSKAHSQAWWVARLRQSPSYSSRTLASSENERTEDFQGEFWLVEFLLLEILCVSVGVGVGVGVSFFTLFTSSFSRGLLSPN